VEPGSDPTPLVTLVGETASGKSALAVELARQFNGEVIAADSRTVYKGMDIGTAKPTKREQGGVRHHLLDVVEPNQTFTAAEFKRLANHAIDEIAGRGKLPFMVGGTGLYIDSVIYNFDFNESPNSELRKQLQLMSIEDLQYKLRTEGIALPQNSRNPRHLIRAIETKGVVAGHAPLRQNTLVLGLRIDRTELQDKVRLRVDEMMAQGYVAEVERLAEQYGWDAPGLQTPGYKVFRKYLAQELTLDEAKDALVREHLQLAKRQRTWFGRNKSIHWICKKEEAVDLLTTFLNKGYTAS
jgi:tRNA dimethylallyltransferase